MTVIGDSRAIFGFPPDLPVEVSPMVMRYKIRARSGQFARIFLFVADSQDPLKRRVEEWYLGSDGNALYPWIQKGENITP